MQKIQKFINVTVLAAETSHIFCCVLPVVVSGISLLVGMGLIGAVPAGVLKFHDIMHGWEMPIIITSGLVILLGWWLHDYAKKLDCHDACGHEPCGPKKERSAKILKIATVLFMINVSVYFFIHRPTEAQLAHDHAHNVQGQDGHAEHSGHDDHHGHDH